MQKKKKLIKIYRYCQFHKRLKLVRSQTGVGGKDGWPNAMRPASAKWTDSRCSNGDDGVGGVGDGSVRFLAREHDWTKMLFSLIELSVLGWTMGMILVSRHDSKAFASFFPNSNKAFLFYPSYIHLFLFFFSCTRLLMYCNLVLNCTCIPFVFYTVCNMVYTNNAIKLECALNKSYRVTLCKYVYIFYVKNKSTNFLFCLKS